MSNGGEKATYDPVSLGEIKELAQVGRPTVSNWRRRHTKEALASASGGEPRSHVRRPFPDPVAGTVSKPLFDAEEIAEWLDARPVAEEPPKDDGTSPTYGDRFRAGLRRRRLVALKYEVGSAEQLLTSAMAVLAIEGAGHKNGRTSLPGELLADYDSADVRVVNATRDLVAAVGSPGDAADVVLGLGGRLESDLAVYATPPAVVRLVSALVGSVAAGQDRRTGVGLCAGTGDLLLGLTDVKRGGGLAAAEPDAVRRKLMEYRLWSRCMRRAEVRSLPEELEIGSADVVLADPPYVPGELDQDETGPLDWAERAVRMLTARGRAYVLVPAWTLARSRGIEASPTVRTRDALLEAGCVEAVVQLPRRIHAFRTGAELALLVLRPAGAGELDDVLLVDADRTAGRVGGRGWVEATARTVLDSRAARPEEARFFSVREAGDGGERLLDGRSVLPGHRLSAAEEGVDHFEATVDARRAVWSAMPELRDWLGHMGLARRREPIRHQKLDTHLRGGQLRLLPGHRVRESGMGEAGLPVVGREEMLGESPIGKRRIAVEELAQYANAVTTDAGDVLLLAEHGVRCLVDDTGGSVLLAPVQALRITAYRGHRERLAEGKPVERDALWMRSHPLACLLQAPRNQQRGSGSLVRRVSVGEMDLPVITPREVEELESVLLEAERQREQVRRRLAVLDDLSARISAGVADGGLTVRRRTA